MDSGGRVVLIFWDRDSRESLNAVPLNTFSMSRVK